jgi:hypothetical protein
MTASGFWSPSWKHKNAQFEQFEAETLDRKRVIPPVLSFVTTLRYGDTPHFTEAPWWGADARGSLNNSSIERHAGFARVFIAVVRCMSCPRPRMGHSWRAHEL